MREVLHPAFAGADCLQVHRNLKRVIWKINTIGNCGAFSSGGSDLDQKQAPFNCLQNVVRNCDNMLNLSLVNHNQNLLLHNTMRLKANFTVQSHKTTELTMDTHKNNVYNNKQLAKYDDE